MAHNVEKHSLANDRIWDLCALRADLQARRALFGYLIETTKARYRPFTFTPRRAGFLFHVVRRRMQQILLERASGRFGPGSERHFDKSFSGLGL